jgi:hypothetical protein
MSLLDTASLVVTPNGTKAGKLYSVVPSSGAGDLDVTRATTATRVNSSGLIQSVASNVPRLDYTNGSCPSILVEPQRTNLVLRSQEFNSSDWGAIDTTITANTTISPSGVQDAETMTISTSASRIFQTLTLGAGTYTASIYVKSLSGTPTIEFRMVVDGSDITQSIPTTSSWVRHDFTFTASVAVSFFVIRGVSGTGSVAIWGAQLEAGSYATSYIPTTSASVTRNADVISKTGISSLIGQTEGTFFVDAYIDELTDLNAWFLKENATFDTFVFLQRETSGIIAVGYYGSGALQARIETGASQPIGRYKIAFGYKNNDFVLYINGTQIGTDTSGTVSGLMDYIDLHWTQTGKNKQNTVALWKTRLTNTQLAQLTTI